MLSNYLLVFLLTLLGMSSGWLSTLLSAFRPSDGQLQQLTPPLSCVPMRYHKTKNDNGIDVYVADWTYDPQVDKPPIGCTWFGVDNGRGVSFFIRKKENSELQYEAGDPAPLGYTWCYCGNTKKYELYASYIDFNT